MSVQLESDKYVLNWKCQGGQEKKELEREEEKKKVLDRNSLRAYFAGQSAEAREFPCNILSYSHKREEASLEEGNHIR